MRYRKTLPQAGRRWRAGASWLPAGVCSGCRSLVSASETREATATRPWAGSVDGSWIVVASSQRDAQEGFALPSCARRSSVPRKRPAWAGKSKAQDRFPHRGSLDQPVARISASVRAMLDRVTLLFKPTGASSLGAKTERDFEGTADGRRTTDAKHRDRLRRGRQRRKLGANSSRCGRRCRRNQQRRSARLLDMESCR